MRLANVMEAAGYPVTREYYINDAGGQVDTLARSRSCATARRSVRRSARSLKVFIPASIWFPLARRCRNHMATSC
jgi:hypothetical protein